MVRRALALLLVALLALPAPSWAQASLLGDLQTERARYGVTISPTQVAALLNAVAWRHRNEGWGLLSKTGGAFVPLGATQRISGDILFHLPSRHHFDVLIDWDGSDNKWAQPTWSDVGEMDPARFVAPVDPATLGGGPSNPGGGGGGGTPTAPGVTKVDLQTLEDNIVVRLGNRFDDQGHRFDDLGATLDRIFGCTGGRDSHGNPCMTLIDNFYAITGQTDALAAQLKAHDEKTSKLVAFFTDGKTITAIVSAVSTWLALAQRKGN